VGSWAFLIGLGLGLATGGDRVSPDVIESAGQPKSHFSL